jgi:RND family efflux transporter MFP subunit
MRVFWNILIVLALMAGAGYGGYLIGHRSASSQTDEGSDSGDSGDDLKATPTVQTVPIKQGRVDRTITAYGVVTAETSDVTVLSVAFESRVKRIYVAPGERLDSESEVIEVEPSPDTQLQMEQAKTAVDAARKDLDQTKQRFNNHLATNQDLLQSQQALDLAQLKLDSMTKSGADRPVRLKAAGLVSKVDVQEGQVVPAGGALAEIAGGGKLQVRLGLEPDDAAKVHPGDAVKLWDVRSDGSPVDGHVRIVAQRINPDTRLVDAFVSLPPDSTMALDAYVRGVLSMGSAEGLVVPRAAVLPGDEGYSLFTVDQGKAAEHKVTIGARNDDLAQISGEGLSAGQSVVVVGNMELEDGMAVKAVAAQEATTAPTQEAGAQESGKPQATTQEAAQ